MLRAAAASGRHRTQRCMRHGSGGNRTFPFRCSALHQPVLPDAHRPISSHENFNPTGILLYRASFFRSFHAECLSVVRSGNQSDATGTTGCKYPTHRSHCGFSGILCLSFRFAWKLGFTRQMRGDQNVQRVDAAKRAYADTNFRCCAGSKPSPRRAHTV